MVTLLENVSHIDNNQEEDHMNKYAVILLSSIVLFNISHSANATIIDNGDYTTDTTSGFDWLDITFTLDRSYNDVLSSLSTEFSGWRFATGKEFDDLIYNAAFQGLPNNAYIKFSTEGELLSGLAQTLGTSAPLPDGSGDAGVFTIGRFSDRDAGNGLVFGGIYQTNFWRFYQPTTLTMGDNDTSAYHGSWLVRNSSIPVPEPETYVMFLAGLGLLSFATKRKVASKI